MTQRTLNHRSGRRARLALACTLVFGLSLGTVASASAADEVNVSTGATREGPGLAVHGYDVVSFFSGTPAIGSGQFAYAYNGGTYRFVSQENLDAFKADPAKYEPRYGGFCAYGATRGKKFDGDPRYWKIVDGKLYLNLDKDIQAKWSEDIPGNIKKADANWEKIHNVAAKQL
jgi:YHS domain-containing protein